MMDLAVPSQRQRVSRMSRDIEVEQAVADFGPAMFGLALAIAANVIDAEDAYQTAWLEAIGHWDQLRESSKRRQWLASIVARAAQRTLRRRMLWRRRHTGLAEATILAVAVARDPAPVAALSRLSRRQRAVVALHYGQGYSLAETADILSCSAGSVRSHLARALAKLRRELADDDT